MYTALLRNQPRLVFTFVALQSFRFALISTFNIWTEDVNWNLSPILQKIANGFNSVALVEISYSKKQQRILSYWVYLALFCATEPCHTHVDNCWSIPFVWRASTKICHYLLALQQKETTNDECHSCFYLNSLINVSFLIGEFIHIASVFPTK